ncbi:mRNA-decapping enzyme 1A [Cololabis saira]|uniref:mRNA-decapping enzyme 1A n=1 Tax=Cololabis saira TaxID=129043 RepID=UPI002AD3A492|nr:mRNA-decapping enzyme 1A [Cololabis saira]
MATVTAGHLMSLAALQRQDPYINRLLDVTGQVALYNFNSKTNEWEKTEIEGTLFVYTRSASPHHGFTIMNRLNTDNLVEPINKDLEFQLQDPFLLYRNGNLGIYSIWFYDKRDCQRIAQLMVRIVKQEAALAQIKTPERAEAGRTNGVAEPRPIDILDLLSKAKEEYQRAQVGDMDKSIEPNATAAVSSNIERIPNVPSPEKNSHTVLKQITVEELFGSSLPKELSLLSRPAQNTSASGDLSYIQKPPYPPPPHQSPLFTAHDPSLNQQQQAPGLIPAPYALNPSPVFQSVVPRPDPQRHCSISPLMIAGPEHHAGPAGPTAPTAASTTFLRTELMSTLKAAVPSVNADIHKPILAPSFLPNTLVPPHSFQEPKMDVFSQPPNLIKPMSAVPVSPGHVIPGSVASVLLSPSAFQQSLNKLTATASPVVPPAPSEPLSASGGAVEPLPAPCSRTQLQETLIHLIKNDPDFLGAIHDAYLQTLSKDFSNMKL